VKSFRQCQVSTPLVHQVNGVNGVNYTQFSTQDLRLNIVTL